MNRSLLVFAISAGLTLAVSSSASAGLLLFSSGPPDGVAAEPPSYTNCTVCHSGAEVNSGSGSLSIQNVPAEYVPGQVYSLTVEIDDPAAMRWGFEITAVDEAGTGIGSFTITDTTNTQFSSQAGREYVKQTGTGSFAGSAGPQSWSFDWTAPAAGSGTVFFYAAGNAANDNSNSSGDMIYSAATSSAESGAAHADLTLVLQPHEPLAPRGGNLTVPARIRNHSNSTQDIVLVSRVRLSNGSLFPPNGFLLNPIPLSIAPGDQGEAVMVHPIAPTTPLITATYEGLIGIAPATLIDMDTFTVSVTP
ncbi:MAG: hypothetical protein DWQ01_20750 [Planctomycetota bacterium]|nr:MAG: hypothetical protein DWQ01_20750 [Planctomycetota bacterium]